MEKFKSALLYAGLGIPIALGIGYFFYKTFYSTPLLEAYEFKLPEINNNKLQPIVKEINR